MNKMVCVLFVLIMIPLWNINTGESAPPKKPKVEKKEPIEITSDRLDAYNDKKLVIFSGNAVATQADRIIKSDRLLLYYRKDVSENKKAVQDNPDDMGELEKIEAKGRVTVIQKQRIVTGDDAVFFQDTQKIIMTGNAVMREGRNVIRGNKIIVFLDEDRGVVESDNKKRVKAIIYPDDQKTNKTGNR
ncbi:MAG: LptA/OstA family protein [Deltaproteobacteria bacterium]